MARVPAPSTSWRRGRRAAPPGRRAAPREPCRPTRRCRPGRASTISPPPMVVIGEYCRTMKRSPGSANVGLRVEPGQRRIAPGSSVSSRAARCSPITPPSRHGTAPACAAIGAGATPGARARRRTSTSAGTRPAGPAPCRARFAKLDRCRFSAVRWPARASSTLAAVDLDAAHTRGLRCRGAPPPRRLCRIRPAINVPARRFRILSS